MPSFLTVVGLAALPAVGNLIGAALAEAFDVSERALSLALHTAAGVVLGVVGLELMPAALDGTPSWVPILAFVAGGGLFLALERSIGYVRGLIGAGDESAGPLAVFTGVAIDLFSDGVMIGTGAVINPALALLLAIGQVPADVPEGFAAVASLRRAGIPRSQRMAMAAAFTLPVLLGALLGFFALRRAPSIATLSVLAATGGALTTVVVEEMVPEAHKGETSTYGAIFLTAGFAIFAAISVYVG